MSADFVANMEDVLDLHAEPHGPQRSVVCFDETSTQFLWESRPALPPQPGIPLRQDCEYRQEGARNLFLVCGPLAGWRQVAVTQRRTMQDFTLQTRWLVDEAYPEAEMVRVVLDNLNTHRPASLYEIFPTEEARRIVWRLEFHYAPKHGSWLNPVSSTEQAMAEVEFSALSPASAGGSPARRPSRGKSRRRSRSATPPRPPSIGGLTPGTPEPNFIIQTRLYPDPSLSRPMEAASDISPGFTAARYSSWDHTDLDSGDGNSYVVGMLPSARAAPMVSARAFRFSAVGPESHRTP